MSNNRLDFLAITDVTPSIVLDIRYATSNNLTGTIIYPKAGGYVRAPVAHALNLVQQDLNKGGLGLKIFDAYRPLRYQKLFWSVMPDENYVAHPEKGSKHNRGASVDLTLIRLTDGQELEMPSDFDDLSEKAHRDYSRMTDEAAKNCKLLEDIMAKHGFTGWPKEWWHFDFQGWEHYPLEDISFEEIEKMTTTNILAKQPRTKLAFLPTPIQELPRLTKTLSGTRIFIKRDDLTGLALGGNKTRKLEYLFGDASQHDIDTIITAGALQSNHCRQTAAAAAQVGLHCELLLNSDQPTSLEGNVLLDALLGAKIHWKNSPQSPQTLDELAQQLRSQGRKPYIIPYGGSNIFGTLGYVNAMFEIVEQEKTLPQPITHIVLATCSGATHVGLVIGAQLASFSGKIISISVDHDESQKKHFQQELTDLANATAAFIRLNRQFNNDDFDIIYNYAQGYGIVGELEHNAIKLLAQQEGILLDPVYSARAFGGMLDMIRRNMFTKNNSLLFLHTGGQAALFPYAAQLIHAHNK